jgi:hypothetical protein
VAKGRDYERTGDDRGDAYDQTSGGGGIMKLDKYDRLFVVSDVDSDSSITTMDLADLVCHVSGGMVLNDVSIFTTSEEAEYHLQSLRMVARGTAILRGLGLEDLEAAVKSLEELVPFLLDKTMAKVLG